jgi:release factor glutamine methyltransferase
MRDEVVAILRAAGCVFAEEEAELLFQAVGGDGGDRDGDGGGTSAGPWGADDGGGGEAAGRAERLESLVARRCAGEPLEHVVGWAEFCGLRIAVGPGVFVPRRRSEFLVGIALDLARDAGVIVDLCCGSAPFATALATQLPNAEVHAADIDAAQLAYARRNLAPFGDRASAHEGDLFEALPQRLRGQVDLLVVNAPYVPTDAIATLPAEARAFEPLTSLDGGVDGLAVHRRVAAGAPTWLAPGGHLLIETTEAQAAKMLTAFADAGLQAWLAEDEELEATVVIGRL